MLNKELFKKKWFVTLLCFLFWPLGIFFLWKNKFYKKKIRIILTTFSLLFLIFLSIPGNEAIEEEKKAAEIESQQTITNNEKEKQVDNEAKKSDNQDEEISNNDENHKTEFENKEEKNQEKDTETKEKSEDELEENNKIEITEDKMTTKTLTTMMEKIYTTKQIVLDEFAEEDFVVLKITETPAFGISKTRLRKIALTFLKNINYKYKKLHQDKYYINIKVPGIDEYGNDTYVQVVTYTITKESIRKLNYENIFNRGQYKLLDGACKNTVYVHMNMD